MLYYLTNKKRPHAENMGLKTVAAMEQIAAFFTYCDLTTDSLLRQAIVDDNPLPMAATAECN
jgi:hypothetical protein